MGGLKQRQETSQWQYFVMHVMTGTAGCFGGSQQGSENYSKHTDALGLKVEHSFVKKFSKNNLDFSISPLFPN